MAAPGTEKEVRVASIKEFVHRLSTKGSADIEKLLLHLLDTAKNHWNEKATHYLRQCKRSDLPEENIKRLKKEYDKAFNNVQLILRMRQGVSVTKRIY